MPRAAARLGHLASALAPPASPGPLVPPPAGAGPAAAGAAPAASVKLLTTSQLKHWIRHGYIVLQIDDAQLPQNFHQDLFEKALAMSDDARHAAPGSEVKLQQGGRIVRADGEASDWSTLGEDFSALMDTPSIRGAATSLLGAGCLIPSPGAPSPLTANPFDQQFHKVSEVLGVVLGPRWHFEPVKRLPMPPCSVRCC